MNTSKLLIDIVSGEFPEGLEELLLDIKSAVANKKLGVLDTVTQQGICPNNNSENRFVLKDDWKRLVLCTYDEKPLIIKLFNPGSALRRIHYRYLTTNPLIRGYKLHQQLLEAGVTVPKVFACGYVCSNKTPLYSFLVMEDLRHFPNINEYLNSALQADSRKNIVAKYIGNKLASAHNLGFFHGDIKPYHVYVDSGDRWLWIDLDDSKILNPLPHKERVTNLYQTYRYLLKPFAENEIDDFLEAYLESVEPKMNGDKEQIKQEILVHYQKRIKRAERKGRAAQHL
jgi:tRNA A-37 threonylcarbamoyl transferase component Bud32